MEKRRERLILALNLVVIACVPVMMFAQGPLKIGAAIVAVALGAGWLAFVILERRRKPS
jgi:hypothetical protein